MTLVASDLILDFLDSFFAGFVVVDVVVGSVTLSIFGLDLAKGSDASRPVPGRVEGIGPWGSDFFAADDVPTAGGSEVRSHDLLPF